MLAPGSSLVLSPFSPTLTMDTVEASSRTVKPASSVSTLVVPVVVILPSVMVNRKSVMQVNPSGAVSSWRIYSPSGRSYSSTALSPDVHVMVFASP